MTKEQTLDFLKTEIKKYIDEDLPKMINSDYIVGRVDSFKFVLNLIDLIEIVERENG